jgi:ribose transport system permease protein
MSSYSANPVTSAAGRPNLVKHLSRMRGLLIAVSVFVVLVATISNIGAVRLTYYDFSQMSSSGATLALASIGQTFIILSGGFDLSAGAVISLVNVVLATT